MKRTLLKVGNISYYVIIGATSIYTITALLYGVLPADVTQPILDTLNANTAAIIPVGASTAITTATMIALRLGGKSMNEALSNSNLTHRLREQDLTMKLNDDIRLQNRANDLVIAKQNELLASNKVIQKQNDARILFDVANAQRNLLASDTIVPPQVKELYKQALDNLKTIDYDIQPITKVIEQTIIKEVEVKTDTKKVSW